MIITIEEAIIIIDNLHLIGSGRNQHENDLKINAALDMAIEALKAYRPQGEWIVEYTDANGDKWYRCSHCGERFVLIEKGEASIEPYHFCPNCGAQMKGVDNE